MTLVTRSSAADFADPLKVPPAVARAASLMLVVGVFACEEAERPDPAEGEGVEEPEAPAAAEAAMAETAECVNDADDT